MQAPCAPARGAGKVARGAVSARGGNVRSGLVPGRRPRRWLRNSDQRSIGNGSRLDGVSRTRRGAAAGGSLRATVRCGENARVSGRNSARQRRVQRPRRSGEPPRRHRRAPPTAPAPARATGTRRDRASRVSTGVGRAVCDLGRVVDPGPEPRPGRPEELQGDVPVLARDPPGGRERDPPRLDRRRSIASAAVAGTSTATNSRSAVSGSGLDVDPAHGLRVVSVARAAASRRGTVAPGRGRPAAPTARPGPAPPRRGSRARG